MSSEPISVEEPPTAAESKAIAIRPSMEVAARGILIRSFDELQRFAKMCVESGVTPKGMQTVGQAAAAMQCGMEAGLTPMRALQAIVVINGNTSWRGKAAMGLIRAHRLCDYIEARADGEGEEMRGVCISRRNGGAEKRTDFTVKQAARAGLWNKDGPWKTYPDRMLTWRAVGAHVDLYWSDVLGGFPIAEDAIDYPVRVEERQAQRQELPAPATPDPVLEGLAAAVPVEAVVVAAPVAPPPQGCTHPGIPPSKLKPGKRIVCPDCLDELTLELTLEG